MRGQEFLLLYDVTSDCPKPLLGVRVVMLLSSKKSAAMPPFCSNSSSSKVR
jgi:hypothetical protein